MKQIKEEEEDRGKRSAATEYEGREQGTALAPAKVAYELNLEQKGLS